MDCFFHSWKKASCPGWIQNLLLVSCVIWNTSGFHFRPLLFLVFIADLGVDLNQDLALILKYVDDTICIQGIQNEEDVELLQLPWITLYQWKITNNMQFNGDKFQVLRMGNCQGTKDGTLLHTGGWNISITQVDQAKDLCIQMDNVGNFKPQRIAEIAKTRKKSRWVLKSFHNQRYEDPEDTGGC